MERTRKTWGIKNNLFQNDLCEVSILELEPWQRCSWHSHRTKFNQFYVLHGFIFIKLVDGLTRVRDGQIFTTRPGEMHEFQTHEEGAVVQEIMYVKYDPEDIDREKLGGTLPSGEDWVHNSVDELFYCAHCGVREGEAHKNNCSTRLNPYGIHLEKKAL